MITLIDKPVTDTDRWQMDIGPALRELLCGGGRVLLRAEGSRAHDWWCFCLVFKAKDGNEVSVPLKDLNWGQLRNVLWGWKDMSEDTLVRCQMQKLN